MRNKKICSLAKGLISIVVLAGVACSRNSPPSPKPDTALLEQSGPINFLVRQDDAATTERHLLAGVDAENLENVVGIQHTEANTKNEEPFDSLPQAPVPTELGKSKNQESIEMAVELFWKASSQSSLEAPDSFLLTYGVSKDRMIHRLVLPVSKLEYLDHPTFGPVYRYVIHGLRAPKSIFFKVQASKDGKLSPETEAQQIDIN